MQWIKRTLQNTERTLVQCFHLPIFASHSIDRGQAVKSKSNVGVFWTQHSFLDCQHTLVAFFSSGIFTFDLIEESKAIEGPNDTEMFWTKYPIFYR